MIDLWLPSPSKNLLWQVRKGCTLYRGPLSERRRCYWVDEDGREHETFEREVRDLEGHGLIVAMPREVKGGPTRFELTDLGRTWPL